MLMSVYTMHAYAAREEVGNMNPILVAPPAPIGPQVLERALEEYFKTRPTQKILKESLEILDAALMLRLGYSMLKEAVDYDGGQKLDVLPPPWRFSLMMLGTVRLGPLFACCITERWRFEVHALKLIPVLLLPILYIYEQTADDWT